MKDLIFKCEHCGWCCTHIVTKTQFGELGLYLTPAETQLFPRDHVLPLYGSGLKGRRRPRPSNIFAYQMDMMICPHFDKKTHDCRIYDHRPLTCQSFPIDMGLEGYVHRECPTIAKQINEGEPLRLDLTTVPQEIEANRKVLLHIAVGYKERGELWVWALDQKRWSLKRIEDATRFLKDWSSNVTTGP